MRFCTVQWSPWSAASQEPSASFEPSIFTFSVPYAARVMRADGLPFAVDLRVFAG